MRPLLLSFLLFGVVGCSDPTASFTESSEANIPQPTFNGKTAEQITVTSPFTDILVSGECDSRSKALETRMDGSSQWSAITSIAANTPVINCQEKVFSFTVPSLNKLNKNISKSVQLTIEVKALTVAGYSKASTLTILYKPSESKKGNPPGFALGSAGGSQSSASFKLKSRLSHTGRTSMSSNRFQLQSGFRSNIE